MDFPDSGEPAAVVPGGGVLEMHPNGYGFLRDPATNFNRERTDPFVPGTMMEKVGLRGEVVNVARGYARNFLLPRKLAEVATPGRVAEMKRIDQR